MAVSLCAVIVDTRFDAQVLASIANARQHMLIGDQIIFMTDKMHWPVARAELALLNNVVVSNRSYSAKTIAAYNQLMLSVDFWRLFDTDYVLVFQRDSRFCAYSRHRLRDFLGESDYIGAPWRRSQINAWVGNGGFSLRNRTAMLRCTGEPGAIQRRVNEDVELANCVLKLGLRLASKQRASEFAVEAVRLTNHTPLAIHKAWNYLANDRTLIRLCPEVASFL